MKTDKELVDRIAFLLVVNEYAQLRTGGQRTVTQARRVLKTAAVKAGVEVATKSENGFVSATVR